MRTTVTMEPDVAAAVERLRRERGVGPSEIINELIRTGLRAPKNRPVFTQRSYDLGLRIDVSNVAEALETLDGPAAP